MIKESNYSLAPITRTINFYFVLFIVSISLFVSPFSLGLDPKVLSSVVNQASGRCWSSDTYNPCPGVIETVPSSNNYQGGFKTGLMAKVCTLLSNLS